MPFRASLRTVLLAVLVSAPTTAISAWSVAHTATQLLDPCVGWHGSGRSQGVALGPHERCRSVTVNGESRVRAITTSVLIPGLVLAGTVLAMIGVAMCRRPLVLAGAIILLCETPVVFTIAPLTLLTGLLYLLFARRAGEGLPSS